MRQHGKAGAADQPRIDADIDRAHQRRDIGGLFAKPVQDRGFARLPVTDELRGKTWRVFHRAAVTGKISVLGTAGELLQRRHVIAHRAVRRRDDGGGPGHHMIAGEQQIGATKRESHVVRRVARRRDGLQAPARTGDDFTVLQRHIGNEVAVGAGLGALGVADMQRTRRAVRTFGIGLRAGRRFDRRGGRRVIAMGMGDEDMRHGLAAHRVEQGVDMRLIRRSGIDDGDVAAPEDVADGAFEGEWAGIVGKQAPHAGRDFLGLAGREIEALVEADVVFHRGSSNKRGRRRESAATYLAPARGREKSILVERLDLDDRRAVVAADPQ